MARLAILTPPDTPPQEGRTQMDRNEAIQRVQRRVFYPQTPESPERPQRPIVTLELTASPTLALPPPTMPTDARPQSDIKLFALSNPFSDLKLESKIGEGQWGDVYQAHLSDASRHRRNDSGIGMSDFEDEAGILSDVLAIKKATNKSSIKVLRHEAKILTFLMAMPGSCDYVVPFLGYDLQHQAVVMQYVPQTLEGFVSELEVNPDRAQIVSRTIHRFSKFLVDGLRFLHKAAIIHGDIKPSNILIQGNRHEFMQPVYCDFTASRFNNAASDAGESVGTYDYMAPEQFKTCASENTPSFASDVYGLGMTLIYAVTGQSPFEDASNVFMRRAMAMEGDPLHFVSSSLRSLNRLKASGFEPLLDGAIRKQPQKRWSSEDWKLKLGASVVMCE